MENNCVGVFFLGLHLYQKETPTKVLSCEIFEIYKNTYFEEPLRTLASMNSTN